MIVVVAFLFRMFRRPSPPRRAQHYQPPKPRVPPDQQDLARLTAAKLPRLYATDAFCGVAGVQRSTLNWLTHKTSRHYVCFSLKKSNGDDRPILSPKKKLKTVQRWILANILEPALAVPREQRRRLRAILFNAKKTGLAAQNREKHPRFAESLRGRIAFVGSVQPEKAMKLAENFVAIS